MATSSNGLNGSPRDRRWPRWPPLNGWVSGFILGCTAGFLAGLAVAGLLVWASSRR